MGIAFSMAAAAAPNAPPEEGEAKVAAIVQDIVAVKHPVERLLGMTIDILKSNDKHVVCIVCIDVEEQMKFDQAAAFGSGFSDAMRRRLDSCTTDGVFLNSPGLTDVVMTRRVFDKLSNYVDVMELLGDRPLRLHVV